jgi:hypothetical protein
LRVEPTELWAGMVELSTNPRGVALLRPIDLDDHCLDTIGQSSGIAATEADRPALIEFITAQETAKSNFA